MYGSGYFGVAQVYGPMLLALRGGDGVKFSPKKHSNDPF